MKLQKNVKTELSKVFIEIGMLIILAGLFSTFSVLSMVFNDYFRDISILGHTLPFNVSVIFFCLGFFILDLVTEIYDEKTADLFIILKIITQITFVSLGYFAIQAGEITENTLTHIVLVSPHMIFNSIIATIFGFKLTVKIMHHLKIRYNGRFLILRYLASTLPGEFVFSLVFSLLSFSQGRTIENFFKMVFMLIFVKFLLSICFAVIMDPITRIMQHTRKQKLSALVAR